MLQTTPVLARIRKALVGRVLSELKTRAKDAAGYAKFWETFGSVLKEGVFDDPEHRTEIAGLLRFRSSSQEGWVSLADYIGRMQPGQEAVYYLTGDDTEALAASPQLEGLRARNFEVLLLADSIDAFWPERLGTFEGKPLRSVTQAAAELDKGADLPDISVLTTALKAALVDQVAEVRATARLTDSAAVLSASGNGPDLQMQRLLRRSGRGGPPARPVLEINPRHALIEALGRRVEDKEMIAQAAATLLDLARVQEGELPRDPARFARRVADLLAGSIRAES
jgi:molecular chaperone HtpG